MSALGQHPAQDQTGQMIVDVLPFTLVADSHRSVGEGAMSLLPYLVGVAGAVALLLTVLLCGYCLLRSTSSHAADPDAFFRPDHGAETGSRRPQALRSSFSPTLSRVSTAFLFRRT